MRFRQGDIVRICKKFTDLDGENLFPQNTDGKVITAMDNGEYPIRVKFDGVNYDSQVRGSEFKERELKLVRRP